MPNPEIDPKPHRHMPARLGRFIRILGPGVITGAADDDPSGIATYAQSGAQFGYSQLWTMLWIYPLMKSVQEHCARLGAVTGKGLAQNVKQHYPRILGPIVMLVVIANVLNIGADIGAMAEATALIVPLPSQVLAPLYSLLILGLVIMLSYRTYARLLKWLALTLLAYLVTALVVEADWPAIARATLIPTFQLSHAYIFMITAVLGTTISPYLFFWQTSEVVEEEIADHRLAQKGGLPRLSQRFMRNLSTDNAVGMLISNVTAWFIIVTTATVLHQNGVTNIQTAADAAKALEPLVQGFPHAGFLAKAIFASGIVGLGLLAVPILAGSASYALSETFGWEEGLYRKYGKARNFYGVIILATLIGLIFTFGRIDPIKALIYSAVINAIAAVPLIFLLGKLGRREDVMGEYRPTKLNNRLVWLTFGLMSLASVAVIVGLF